MKTATQNIYGAHYVSVALSSWKVTLLISTTHVIYQVNPANGNQQAVIGAIGDL
ncbi:MAG: hypothetical protein KKD18_06120 [Nanoarchaeota archaeon]|nr:hypothetical protein [Nanoarchaeota archaeon]